MLILDMISLLEEYGILWRNYLRKQNSLFPPHGFEVNALCSSTLWPETSHGQMVIICRGC